MNFEIDGKEVELRFGVGFVRKLDEIYEIEQEGIKFGGGLILINVGLRQMNPATLIDIILCSAVGKVTQRKVEAALDDYADENDGLGELFEELESEMGKSSVIKDTMKRNQERAMKEQEKMDAANEAE